MVGREVDNKLTLHQQFVVRILSILFHCNNRPFSNNRGYVVRATCCCAYICSRMVGTGHSPNCLPSMTISLLDPFLFLFVVNSPFARLALSIHLGPQLTPLAFSLVLYRRRRCFGRCDERLRALRTALRGGFSLLCKCKCHERFHRDDLICRNIPFVSARAPRVASSLQA